MLSNLVSQLREQNAEDRYEDVLAEIPHVRAELGYPPLVTPSSQLVGTQATLNIMLGERYKIIPHEVKEYIRGFYGRPPAPIASEVKRLAIGDEEPIDCRPADLISPGYEKAAAEIGDLARSEEDVLSYVLYPQVARDFLQRRRETEVQSSNSRLQTSKSEVQKSSMPSPWKIAGRVFALDKRL
jgi:oxaloacetate decarboxylase alpha subunit